MKKSAGLANQTQIKPSMLKPIPLPAVLTQNTLQVEMLTAQEIKCPISLEAPVCPQITPCGHVFAFPSILAHLMKHGGDNLRKASPCPLCFQPIVARELRLVKIKIVNPPKVQGTSNFFSRCCCKVGLLLFSDKSHVLEQVSMWNEC